MVEVLPDGGVGLSERLDDKPSSSLWELIGLVSVQSADQEEESSVAMPGGREIVLDDSDAEWHQDQDAPVSSRFWLGGERKSPSRSNNDQQQIQVTTKSKYQEAIQQIEHELGEHESSTSATTTVLDEKSKHQRAMQILASRLETSELCDEIEVEYDGGTHENRMGKKKMFESFRRKKKHFGRGLSLRKKKSSMAFATDEAKDNACSSVPEGSPPKIDPSVAGTSNTEDNASAFSEGSHTNEMEPSLAENADIMANLPEDKSKCHGTIENLGDCLEEEKDVDRGGEPADGAVQDNAEPVDEAIQDEIQPEEPQETPFSDHTPGHRKRKVFEIFRSKKLLGKYDQAIQQLVEELVEQEHQQGEDYDPSPARESSPTPHTLPITPAEFDDTTKSYPVAETSNTEENKSAFSEGSHANEIELSVAETAVIVTESQTPAKQGEELKKSKYHGTIESLADRLEEKDLDREGEPAHEAVRDTAEPVDEAIQDKADPEEPQETPLLDQTPDRKKRKMYDIFRSKKRLSKYDQAIRQIVEELVEQEQEQGEDYSPGPAREPREISEAVPTTAAELDDTNKSNYLEIIQILSDHLGRSDLGDEVELELPGPARETEQDPDEVFGLGFSTLLDSAMATFKEDPMDEAEDNTCSSPEGFAGREVEPPISESKNTETQSEETPPRDMDDLRPSKYHDVIQDLADELEEKRVQEEVGVESSKDGKKRKMLDRFRSKKRFSRNSKSIPLASPTSNTDADTPPGESATEPQPSVGSPKGKEGKRVSFFRIGSRASMPTDSPHAMEDNGSTPAVDDPVDVHSCTVSDASSAQVQLESIHSESRESEKMSISESSGGTDPPTDADSVHQNFGGIPQFAELFEARTDRGLLIAATDTGFSDEDSSRRGSGDDIFVAKGGEFPSYLVNDVDLDKKVYSEPVVVSESESQCTDGTKSTVLDDDHSLDEIMDKNGVLFEFERVEDSDLKMNQFTDDDSLTAADTITIDSGAESAVAPSGCCFALREVCTTDFVATETRSLFIRDQA